MNDKTRWLFVMENIMDIERYARLLCKGSGLDLEDFLQDLKVHLHRDAHKYDSERGRPRSFIYMKTLQLRGMRLDKWERRVVSRNSISTVMVGETEHSICETLPHKGSTPEDIVAARSELALIDDEGMFIIGMLHDRQTYAQIARTLGKPVSHVCRTIERMRAQWRERQERGELDTQIEERGWNDTWRSAATWNRREGS